MPPATANEGNDVTGVPTDSVDSTAPVCSLSSASCPVRVTAQTLPAATTGAAATTEGWDQMVWKLWSGSTCSAVSPSRQGTTTVEPSTAVPPNTWSAHTVAE